MKRVLSTVWTSLDVDVEVRFPLSPVPAADMFRRLKVFLKELHLPQDMTASLKITDVAFTTGQDLCLFVCFALCRLNFVASLNWSLLASVPPRLNLTAVR